MNLFSDLFTRRLSAAQDVAPFPDTNNDVVNDLSTSMEKPTFLDHRIGIT